MSDPELISSEKVLVRTEGVYVKAIPFEGILTNKRIILIDTTRNLLRPKKIPLVSIDEIYSHDTIRDHTLTLSIRTKPGETRQLILTFYGEIRANRKKDRDLWQKLIRENSPLLSRPVDPVSIPGAVQSRGREGTKPPGPDHASITARQIVNVPATSPPAIKTEIQPVITARSNIKPIIIPPEGELQKPVTLPPGIGLFCTSCGKKVPSGSAFCNRCGSKISPPLRESSSMKPVAG
jgi:hypothetical protein